MSKRLLRFRRIGFKSPFWIASLFLVLLSVSAFGQDPSNVRITIGSAPLVPGGTIVHLPIQFENPGVPYEFGNFDVLISYDTSAVTYIGTDKGQLLRDCHWDYFQATDPAPGLLRIVSVANVVGGAKAATCFLESQSGVLANVTFRTRSNDSLYCHASPIRFYWADCGDNMMGSRTGDTLYVSNHVWDEWSHGYIEQDDIFPTIHGAPDTCIATTQDLTPLVRLVDYFNGYIEFTCPEPNIYRGDLNLNGIAYEIADFMILRNYFLYGLAAFTINTDEQVAASDVDGDGTVLTLHDLIYLYRVIVGDAQPAALRTPGETSSTAVIVQDTLNKIIVVSCPDSLAAALLGFSGSIAPQLAVYGMDLAYTGTNSTTVLIYPDFSGLPQFGDGILISYTGSGTLVSAQVADYGSTTISTTIEYAQIPNVVYAVDSFTVRAGDPSVEIPVYARVSSTDLIAFIVDLQLSDTLDLRFDAAEPVTAWGDEFSNWSQLAGISQGHPGTFLRLIGLGENGQAIPAGPADILLARVKLLPDSSYLASHCDSSGKVIIVYSDASNSLGQSIPTGGGDGEYLISCSLPCGDADGNGIVNISDALRLICWVFGTCESPADLGICDVNRDGIVNIADVVYLISYIFGGGPAPCEDCQ